MVSTKPSRSQEIRSRLGHPIIDSDGHTLEVMPLVVEFVGEVGGAKMKKRYEEGLAQAVGVHWHEMSQKQRDYEFVTAPGWWFESPKTVDRVTATIPKLLHSRMDEIGIDYAVLYPTQGLFFDRIPDPEVRQAGCRGLNAYLAEVYRPYADRMTPAAAIPMQTPEMAIEELEYAVNVLGLKVAMIEGRAMRPLIKVGKEFPELGNVGRRMDVLTIDGDYDYDPFWAKCIELNVAPASHAANMGWGTRSTSNYMYNHLNTFSVAHESLAKALFLGGVTKRFPELRVAFLEGGVGWACQLFSDIIGHWEKRGGAGIRELDPRHLDVEAMMGFIAEKGEPSQKARMEEIRKLYVAGEPAPDEIDDFSRVPMERPEEMLDLFVDRFFFGCEADDPMNAHAFNTKVNPMGAKLRAIFSSDIGHWDVSDVREVVEEAYELVEHELMTEEDFRDFTFTNAAHFYGDMNPDFFKGTVVEEAAARELKGG